jgi:hypothetical protein
MMAAAGELTAKQKETYNSKKPLVTAMNKL